MEQPISVWRGWATKKIQKSPKLYINFENMRETVQKQRSDDCSIDETVFFSKERYFLQMHPNANTADAALHLFSDCELFIVAVLHMPKCGKLVIT